MGAKLYADTTTKTLVVTLAPDGNGEVTINAQIDVWSDLIEDWESTLALRQFSFPLVAIGGQTISAGKLGTTYVLLTPWQIAPYEADHELIVDGNLFTESALTKLILPTVGGYTVTGTRNLSTLVEVVETGVSGLTAPESSALTGLGTDVGLLQTDVAAIETNVDTLTVWARAKKVTSQVYSKLFLTDSISGRTFEADLFQDEAETLGYDPEAGIEVQGELTETT